MYQSSHYASCVPAFCRYNSCNSSSNSRLEYIANDCQQERVCRQERVFYPAARSVGPLNYSAGSVISGNANFLNRLFYQTRALPRAFSQVSYKPSADCLFKLQAEYHFLPDDFLKPGEVSTFVGRAEEVKEFVEEAFERIFAQPFPSDIKISVLDEKKFRRIAPSPNTVGLSVNRSEYGLLSEIFVLNDSLGRVMLTIGHELGHVLTPALQNKHDEEAKAYAFSLLWMKVIKEQNIADLGDAIVNELPAENGLHNVAFGFVQELIKRGEDLLDIYLGIIRRILFVDPFCASSGRSSRRISLCPFGQDV
ncbi:MAG: hypothetical protein AB1668_07245 [Nanoarchaeota archaeon]